MVKLNAIIVIARIIRCCIGDRQERWDDFVGIAVGAIRATVNRSTPNRMMLGREVMMPMDLMLGSDGEEVLLGPILRMAGWRHIEKQGKYWKETEKVLRFEEESHNLRSRGCSIEEK